MMRTVIVTQEPLEGTKDEEALAYMMGIETDEFHEKFATISMLAEPLDDEEGDISVPMAREAIKAIVPDLAEFDRIVLFGREVTKPMGFPTYVRSLNWRNVNRRDIGVTGMNCCYLPGNFGRNSWYSVPANKRRAEEFLRKLASEAEVIEDSGQETNDGGGDDESGTEDAETTEDATGE